MGVVKIHFQGENYSFHSENTFETICKTLGVSPQRLPTLIPISTHSLSPQDHPISDYDQVIYPGFYSLVTGPLMGRHLPSTQQPSEISNSHNPSSSYYQHNKIPESHSLSSASQFKGGQRRFLGEDNDDPSHPEMPSSRKKHILHSKIGANSKESVNKSEDSSSDISSDENGDRSDFNPKRKHEGRRNYQESESDHGNSSHENEKYFNHGGRSNNKRSSFSSNSYSSQSNSRTNSVSTLSSSGTRTGSEECTEDEDFYRAKSKSTEKYNGNSRNDRNDSKSSLSDHEDSPPDRSFRNDRGYSLRSQPTPTSRKFRNERDGFKADSDLDKTWSDDNDDHDAHGRGGKNLSFKLIII